MMNKINLVKSIGLIPLISLTLNVLPYTAAMAQETLPEQPKAEDPKTPDTKPVEPIIEETPVDELDEMEAKTAPLPVSPFNYRIELETNGEYSSNVKQTVDGEGDFINRTGLNATLRYTFPTNTQLLLRGQAMLNRYLKSDNYNQNQTLILGTFTLSQLLFDSLNIYAGVIPIYLKSDTDQVITRHDTDWMGGATYYYLAGWPNILFGGYQLDRLEAEDLNFRYIGHTLLAGYRQTFTPELNLTLTGRGQFRFFTEKASSNEQRYVANLTFRYSPFSWLSLATKSEYTFVNSADTKRTTGFYTLGLNVTGGF